MSFKVREIFEALSRADIRYVVVGGFAVILHGHARATRDLDLVIELAKDNFERALAVLSSIGLTPRHPVSMADLADPRQRDEWRANRNMVAFPFWDKDNPERLVDVFIHEPIDFPELHAQAVIKHLDGVPIPIASIAHLIAMKTGTGRRRDADDIEALQRLDESGSEETE